MLGLPRKPLHSCFPKWPGELGTSIHLRRCLLENCRERHGVGICPHCCLWKALSLLPIWLFPSHHLAQPRSTPPAQGVHPQHVILLALYSSSLFKIKLLMCFCLSLPGTLSDFSTDIRPNTRKFCRDLAHSMLSINIFE